MSIAPPSDIILDVAQAADPLRLQAATTKLAQAAAGAERAGSFAAVLAGGASAASRPASPPPVVPSAASGPAQLSGESRHTTVDRKFEAMVLQSFIENILPKNSDLFGDAASADMGRSLLAEQIANQLAKSGRIGIAKSMEQTAGAAAAPLPLAPPIPRA